MEYKHNGRIIKCVGGLYTVRLINDDALPLSGADVECRARGNFRHEKMTPLVGDNVIVRYDDGSFILDGDGTPHPDKDGRGIVIDTICERKNSLIRPPLSNLDYVLVCMAATQPEPDISTIDKLLCILEFNKIEPVVIIGKSELSPEAADRLEKIYSMAGYRVFKLSCATGDGIDAVRNFIDTELGRGITAVAGASGVGKSTLLNTLFPSLALVTGNISEKIMRGKNTTRHTQLYPLSGGGYIADTAGFSLLDFERFDFMDKEDLPYTMREFRPLLGSCRYTDCTHTKEEDCAIVSALRRGEIAPTRHQSFLELYAILKDKHKWDK